MIKKIKEKISSASSLSKYVTFSIASLIIYTIVSQYIAIHYEKVLDTLTTCFFGFFGGEITICGLIKIFKLKDTKKETIGNDDGGLGVG